MATSSPASTVSYNTESFLKSKLDKWYNEHLIQAFHYIKHKGEDGDKDHIHLRIEPNKRIDLMDLSDQLREIVPGNKPLGCRPWRSSKEEPWFLYAVHDPMFMKITYGINGLKKEKKPYTLQEITVSPGYDLDVAWVRAQAWLEHSSCNLTYKLQAGVAPVELLKQGENVHMVNALMVALNQNDYVRVTSELNTYKDILFNMGYYVKWENDNAVLYDLNTNECVDIKSFNKGD